jgi:hypothetical protein
MRGRRPAGPEYVDHLGGSDTAKERLKVILQTLAGSCRVQEACVRLGISEPRFHQLRSQMLAAALDGLEPQTPGRKPRTLTPAEEQVRVLQQQLTQQELDLRLARAREEVALILPRVVGKSDDAAANEKKTPAGQRPGCPPGKRKNT